MAIESACKEAYEEAGIEGRADPRIIGEYQYQKWGGNCVVQVFAMEVTKVLDSWPEADLRQRKWLGKDAAVKVVGKSHLKKLIRNFSPASGD